MQTPARILRGVVLLARCFLLPWPSFAQSTNSFVVAAYNVENWVLMERHGKPDQPKPTAERQAVCNVLAAIHPDVLGIEEMGGTNQLAELREGLRAKGFDYPHSEWVQGLDETRHV